MERQRANYKTSMCRHFTQKGYCSLLEKCHFAHGPQQLRQRSDPLPDVVPQQVEPLSIYKTTLCKYFMNGYCRNASLCPFAHGLNDVHQISIKNSEPPPQTETEYGNAGEFLYSILKCLEVVFSQNEDKKELLRKGMELVEEKNLPQADEVITKIVKCPSLTDNQRQKCQTILQNAYALHKIRYSPF